MPRWKLALAQEAARGISPSSSLWFFDDEVLNRILTAFEEFLFKCFSLPNLFFTHYTIQCANHVHFSVVDNVFGIRLGALRRGYCLVLTRHSTAPGGLTQMLHSPDLPDGFVENDSYFLPGLRDVVLRPFP